MITTPGGKKIPSEGGETGHEYTLIEGKRLQGYSIVKTPGGQFGVYENSWARNEKRHGLFASEEHARAFYQTLVRHEKGLELWRHMGGVPYADQVLENLKRLSPELAHMVIEHASGEIWTRPQLDLKTRSLCNVAALTALGRTTPLRFHLVGALNNGATKEEIAELLLQLSLYCGIPAAVDAFTVAREVFEKFQPGKGI